MNSALLALPSAVRLKQGTQPDRLHVGRVHVDDSAGDASIVIEEIELPRGLVDHPILVAHEVVGERDELRLTVHRLPGVDRECTTFAERTDELQSSTPTLLDLWPVPYDGGAQCCPNETRKRSPRGQVEATPRPAVLSHPRAPSPFLERGGAGGGIRTPGVREDLQLRRPPPFLAEPHPHSERGGRDSNPGSPRGPAAHRAAAVDRLSHPRALHSLSYTLSSIYTVCYCIQYESGGRCR